MLCLVVAFLLTGTRAEAFFADPQPAPGQIASVTPDSTGKTTTAWQYDALDSLIAANNGGRTNAQLVQDVATRADAWGTRQGLGLGPRAGTLKHSYADDLLTRYQSRFGDRGLSTEVPYLNGQAGVGGRGSVRLDVVEGPLANPTAIFDYKFGGATLTPQRVQQIRQVGQFGSNVPITGVHP